ncbi:Velvet complex subunit B [Rhodotorula toruloides]|nr:Velvet complex subunit B [Rhodotorula toruloides]
MDEPVSPPTAGPSSRRIYSLTVVQQPVRARMCGFGDKDRRPISPPIIVKLSSTDAATGREVEVEDIDPTFLVLAADLRGPNGWDDANLVQQHRSTASRPDRTPSLRASSTTSSRSPSQHSHADTPSPSPTTREAVLPNAEHKMSVSRLLSLAEESARPIEADSPAQLAAGLPVLRLSPSQPPPARPVPPQNKRSSPTSSSSSSSKRHRPSPPPSAAFIPYARFNRPAYSADSARTLTNGSSSEDGETEAALVPNLIGTLHTNAYKLRGLDGEKGVYFVLPDLSVRTEGAFRLRLRLVDLRQSMSGANSLSSAAVLTDKFQVFTAKRFTGMLDPTSLSQCFAKQGVRIPTRRAAKAKNAVEQGDEVKQEEE